MEDYDKVKERLWKKKILVGKTKPTEYDPQPHNIYLEAEIKEKANQRRFDNLKKMKKFKTFSISGTSKYFGGQIYDELNPKEVDFNIPKARVQKIKKLWKQWHLSDLKAGTQIQENALKQFKGRKKGWSYNQDVAFLKKKKLLKDRGYQYGTGWLAQPLPENVEKEIMKTFKI